MQAKTGVQKPRASFGRSTAKATANGQGARPMLLAHQVMQTQLQDFRAMLEFIVDRIQFRNGLSGHAEFGIATGRAKLSFEVHAIGNKQSACQKSVTVITVSTVPRCHSAIGRWTARIFARYLYSTLHSRGAAAEPDRAFARQANPRSTRALACPLRRLAAMFCRGKVRDGEGAIASTRGACGPQKEATVPSRFNCGACYLALLTLTRHLLRGNQLKKRLEFAKSLLK